MLEGQPYMALIGSWLRSDGHMRSLSSVPSISASVFFGVCFPMEFRRMDMETLKWKQLQEIRDLENNGLLDANFRNCLSLKEDSSPLFLLNLINVFFTDGLSDITEMTRLLDQPAVDFNMMYIKCVKIKGGSSCFGACGVSNACSDLCSAIDNKSKEGCRQALKSIKHQYYILGSRLDKVVKIEQVIAGRQI